MPIAVTPVVGLRSGDPYLLTHLPIDSVALVSGKGRFYPGLLRRNGRTQGAAICGYRT